MRYVLQRVCMNCRSEVFSQMVQKYTGFNEEEKITHQSVVDHLEIFFSSSVSNW